MNEEEEGGDFVIVCVSLYVSQLSLGIAASGSVCVLVCVIVSCCVPLCVS